MNHRSPWWRRNDVRLTAALLGIAGVSFGAVFGMIQFLQAQYGAETVERTRPLDPKFSPSVYKNPTLPVPPPIGGGL